MVCKLIISLSNIESHLKTRLPISMPELRVTVDEKLNRLLDRIVASGIYNSKAELMRSATIYLLIQMGVLKEHIEKKNS